MIIESIQQAYKVRQGTTATYPYNFLKLVVEGRRLPWWRRVLRRLRGIR